MSKQRVVLVEPLLQETTPRSVHSCRKLLTPLFVLISLSIGGLLILQGGVFQQGEVDGSTMSMATRLASRPFQLARLAPGPWFKQWSMGAAPHHQLESNRASRTTSNKQLSKVALQAANSQHSGVKVSALSTVSEAKVTHPAFKVVETGDVDEYRLGYTRYEHIKTGAEVLSMRNDDENKVFGIAFRTPVSDSTGVPHILEHSVLCGSRKYPVKDPFVHMLRSSVQTFLNAMTYPDRTVYPLASQNLQDFHNLVNVYLDAVLHPRAVKDPQVLQQEGWHIEAPDDPSKPLIYKGVVYNEMKGVYSSPDSRMQRAAMQGLFPDTTYAHDSGGSPEHITSLTFPQFKAFWEQHYHPSNARVYFYGDDPEESRLKLLDGYLSEFGPSAQSTHIETQKKWSEPRRVIEKFPVAAEQAGKEGTPKHMISVNWLLTEETPSATEQLALGVVSYLLMGSTSSTLYKALIESTLGESVTGGGVSDYLMQPTFSVGMKGVKAEDVPKVEALIDSTLQKAVTEGFEADEVEAALNTIEFSLRESNSNSARGLMFFLGALNDWNYDRDPITGLRFEAPLQELKQQLAAPGQKVFVDLIQKYLMENRARLSVEGVPDPELAAAEEASEVQKLSDKKQSLSDSAVGELIEENKKLQAAQDAPDTPENVAKLPALSLSDLDRKAKDLDITIGKKQGLEFLTHDVDSNGVAYVDVAFDLSGLPVEDLPLLPLLTRMMFEVGTSDLSQTAFTRRIGGRTGGISVSVLNSLKNGVDGAVGSRDDIIYKLVVKGKATGEKTGDLLQLMHAGLTDAKLDSQKRAVELLKSSKNAYESAFSSQGNSFAMRRISARLSLAGYIDEITGGTTYFDTLKKLLAQAEEDWPTLLARLESVRSLILSNRDSVIINLSADRKTLDMVDGEFDKFIDSLPSKGSMSSEPKGPTVADAMRCEPKMRLESENEGFVVSTLVNHVARGGAMFSEGEKISGAAQVVQRSLARGYLWDTVRVRGGAYGGSCSLSRLSGTFTCFSYRDPNMVETISAYKQMADHLEKQTLDTTEVEQLVIGAIGDLDKPMSPASKGYTSMLRYLSGETLAIRQALRDEMFATSAADFAEFAKRLRSAENNQRLSIFGSDIAFDQAKLPDIKLEKLG